MKNPPVAFVDESYLDQRGHPGLYLMAAVLVPADELPTVMDAARHAAGPGPYHSTRLYRRGHLTPIENMLDAVHAHAGWAFLVAQAPLDPGGRETARQATLGQLLRQLDQQRVRDVVLDTRASPSEQHQTLLEGRKVNRSDQPDLTTYRLLVRDRTISPRLRVVHVDDHRQPALWMADAVAWAAQRTLVYGEPQWWSRVTGITTVIDATSGRHLTLDSERAAPSAVNPADDRDPRHPSPSAPAPLTRHYTLNAGTTNRAQGPGQQYLHLLAQVTAHADAVDDTRTRVAGQIAALTGRVDDLARSIETATGAAPHPAGPDGLDGSDGSGPPATHGPREDPREPDIG